MDWSTFTVTVSEDEFIDRGPALLRELLADGELLAKKQAALDLAMPDLVYGFGSPLAPNASFTSRVVDRVLAEGFEMNSVSGSYRRFPPPDGPTCTSLGGAAK